MDFQTTTTANSSDTVIAYEETRIYEEVKREAYEAPDDAWREYVAQFYTRFQSPVTDKRIIILRIVSMAKRITRQHRTRQIKNL